MGKSVVDWNWRCFTVLDPILGPRDWSPKVEGALRDLKFKESLLPAHMRLSKEEIDTVFPLLQDAIKAGSAFVAKIGNTHEMVFVCPKGLLLMSDHMKDIFDALLRKEFCVE